MKFKGEVWNWNQKIRNLLAKNFWKVNIIEVNAFEDKEIWRQGKCEIEVWKMKCEGEIWRLKKLWVKKVEIDKFGNEEIWR